METSIIVAIDENNAIGYKNNLLCHLPDDLKRFKKITTGNTIVMGKNTFLSLPKGALPNRKNIVLTSSDKCYKNCIMAKSIKDAINHCQNEEHVFFIGGASVYKESFQLVNNLFITQIHDKFPADTYFPSINYDNWELVSNEFHEASENKPAFTFKYYKRKIE